MNSRIKTLLIGAFFIILPFSVSADYVGQKTDFFVDSSYDSEGRKEISATLREKSSQLYFYFEDEYWNSLSDIQKIDINKKLDELSKEFEEHIYPTLTPTFGIEWKTGIDNDEHITILFHQMVEDVGGYFNTRDEYEKILMPTSNEREILYINLNHINSPNLKGYLAHEFMHMITFNQKDNVHGVSEEVWLNEARADYTSTFLGYDKKYDNSNLASRVRNFLNSPSDSLTEWFNEKADYAVVNLFTQYLVEQYGIEILVDSLTSSKVGISSIEYALDENGFEEDFNQIFSDWVIALLINDCSVGEKYCYSNENLSNLRISPKIILIPKYGETTFSISNIVKDWSGNWHKIIGGKDVLKIEFENNSQAYFHIPYIVEDINGELSIGFIEFDGNDQAILYVEDFNDENVSLTIMPLAQSKKIGFNGEESGHRYSFTVSTVEKTPQQKEEEEQEKLLARIAELKAKIAEIQAKIDSILAQRNQVYCQSLNNNLYFGIQNNEEVRCLQEFLKNQGEEIYPEGLITGNFLSLTQKAVIRFQEKFSSEILEPLDLKQATGFVGPSTRAKINQMLKG